LTSGLLDGPRFPETHDLSRGLNWGCDRSDFAESPYGFAVDRGRCRPNHRYLRKIEQIVDASSGQTVLLVWLVRTPMSISFSRSIFELHERTNKCVGWFQRMCANGNWISSDMTQSHNNNAASEVAAPHCRPTPLRSIRLTKNYCRRLTKQFIAQRGRSRCLVLSIAGRLTRRGCATDHRRYKHFLFVSALSANICCLPRRCCQPLAGLQDQLWRKIPPARAAPKSR
jgi:hypothetical protein